MYLCVSIGFIFNETNKSIHDYVYIDPIIIIIFPRYTEKRARARANLSSDCVKLKGCTELGMNSSMTNLISGVLAESIDWKRRPGVYKSIYAGATSKNNSF